MSDNIVQFPGSKDNQEAVANAQATNEKEQFVKSMLDKMIGDRDKIIETMQDLVEDTLFNYITQQNAGEPLDIAIPISAVLRTFIGLNASVDETLSEEELLQRTKVREKIAFEAYTAVNKTIVELGGHVHPADIHMGLAFATMSFIEQHEVFKYSTIISEELEQTGKANGGE